MTAWLQQDYEAMDERDADTMTPVTPDDPEACE